MRAGLLTQRLVALFVAGWLLLDFPLLRALEGPWLTASLFGLWGLLIAALAWLMERGTRGEPGDSAAGRDAAVTGDGGGGTRAAARGESGTR